MNNATRFLPALAVGLALAAAAHAQRPRTTTPQPPAPGQTTNAPKPPPAPPSVTAKYEGGVVGYRKSEGTLNFDDTNKRLVFRDKNNRELFSLPYASVQSAWPDTRALQPTAANVVGRVPLPYYANVPAWFIKKKYRYLTLQFRDKDTSAAGVTSFKLADKSTLSSVLATLGDKAELTQRGDAYVRTNQASQTTPTSGPE